MDRPTLEKQKFDLSEGKVIMKTSSEIGGVDDISETNINKLEKGKFNSSGNIRTVTEI